MWRTCNSALQAVHTKIDQPRGDRAEDRKEKTNNRYWKLNFIKEILDGKVLIITQLHGIGPGYFYFGFK